MKIKKNTEKQELASRSHAIDETGGAMPYGNDKSEAFCFLAPEGALRKNTIVPAEHVGLHILDLPVRSSRQRREAVPYALEESLGTSLEQLHFAICETYADGRILVAVINRSIMDEHIRNDSDAIVIAEQMLIEPPEQTESGEHTWRSFRKDDRVLIRVSDGTGFAVHAKSLFALWLASGKPAIEAYGHPLPGNIASSFKKNESFPAASITRTWDLRQADYSNRRDIARPVIGIAASVALTLLGHTALMVADLNAHKEIARKLELAASSALESRLPGLSVETPPDLLARHASGFSAKSAGSGFLPVMSDVSKAWSGDGIPVQLRQLTWSDNSLLFVVETPDLESLQRAEASLAAAGLAVSSGSATADAGSARAEITVKP